MWEVLSFSYRIRKSSSTTPAAEAHGLDYRRSVYLSGSVCESDLNLRPIGGVGSVGLRVRSGNAAVCLWLGAEPPQVVADVKQLSVDAVLDGLALQVHPEPRAGQHDGRMILKAFQKVN